MIDDARALLRKYYLRNGYLRVPNRLRRKAEKSDYKKGYEIRLVAASDEELRKMQQALAVAGFKPGKPFKKARQWILPIYGRQAADDFDTLIRNVGNQTPDSDG